MCLRAAADMSRGELSNYRKTRNYLSLTKARTLNKIFAKSKEPTRWLLRLGKRKAFFPSFMHIAFICTTDSSATHASKSA